MALPQKLNYNSHISASHSRQYTSEINCQNTNNHATSSTAIINIPNGRNLFIDGQSLSLQMDMVVTPTPGANTVVSLDRCGAVGAIERLRIFSGSNLLQDVNGYGNLMAMLTSHQHSHDNIKGRGAVLGGTSSNLIGHSFGTITDGTSATARFVVPLTSMLSTSDKYFPLHALSGPLRLEIQFVSSALKLVTSTRAITSINFNNVKLIASYLEVSDAGMNIINKAQNGRPFEYVCTNFANFQSNVTVANGVESRFNLPIPAKYASTKSLFSTLRAHSAGAVNKLPYDSVSTGLEEYTLTIGSQVMPSQPVKGLPNMLLELDKAFGVASNTLAPCGYVKSQYTTESPAGNATNSNAFAIGMDLESYSGKMEGVYRGMNTTASDLYLNLVFSGAQTGAIKVDTYVSFDQMVSIDDSGVPVVQY